MLRNLIIILLVLQFCSCKKENETNEISFRSDTIMMGQSTNMKITNENLVLYPKTGLIHGCQIDLNEDGRFDYFIGIEQVNEYDNKSHLRSYIYGYDTNCLIMGKMISDTVFLNHVDVIIKDTLNHLYIDSFLYYSCMRTNYDDPILNIANKFVASSLISDNILTKNDFYNNDTSYFQIVNFVTTSYNRGLNDNDTIETKKVFYDNYCNFLPFDNIYYYGLKLEENKSVKLGWIKLKIDMDYKITIIESAIQK